MLVLLILAKIKNQTSKSTKLSQNLLIMSYNSVVSYDKLESVLSSKNWDKSYVNLPNSSIGTILKSQFKYIFESVGETFTDDESVLTVQADNGNLKRLYSPTVYLVSNEKIRESAYAKANPSLFEDDSSPVSDEDKTKAKTPEAIKAYEDLLLKGRNVAIRMGAKLFVPLLAFKAIEGCDIALDNGDIEITLPETELFPEGLTVKFSVRYSESDLEKRKSQEASFKRAFSRYLKNTENNLGAFLCEPPTGGGSGIPLRDMDENSTHTVIGYEFKESENGGFYILTLDTGIRVMSNKALATTLRGNPTVSPEKPSTLRIADKKKMANGNMKVNAALLIPVENYPNDDGFSLDW
jgi:hypothetical protein